MAALADASRISMRGDRSPYDLDRGGPDHLKITTETTDLNTVTRNISSFFGEIEAVPHASNSTIYAIS